MEEIKKEAKRLIELFFKHSKGQTDDVRMIHARCNCLVCLNEKMKEIPMYKGGLNPQWKFLNQVKKYIEQNY